MGKKDKKADKKDQKENKEQLSAVDKTFYEITINDLNNKLINLRKRNADLEEKNAELETQMVQLDEDRADIIAFLRRSVLTQTSNIKELEEKLSELAKVRAEETERFENIISDWESKYKAMHDQLSSEIKLLAGKLNYLEEFRLQHDDLMAKFDQQDRNLKEQEQRHKDTLYELEHKQIAEKVQLKNQLEGRLLQLSNEFAKTNQIRTAAHVQRMTRENIALTNEIDCLLHTVERLNLENGSIKAESAKKRQYHETILEENAHLMGMCQKHLKIINRLTTECERLNADMKNASKSDKLRKMAEVRETVSRKELNESKSKLESMQASLNEQKKDCQLHSEIDSKRRQEVAQLLGILRQLKLKLNATINCDQSSSVESQRHQLLDELLQILMSVQRSVDDATIADETVEIGDQMTPLTGIGTGTGYQKGKVGITPRQATTNILKFSQQSYKGRRKSIMNAGQEQFNDLIKDRPTLVGCAIIDVDDDASHLDDEVTATITTTKSMDEEKKIELTRKPSMIQISSDSSNGDE